MDIMDIVRERTGLPVLMIEADMIDAASGMPMAKVVRKVFGKTLELARAETQNKKTRNICIADTAQDAIAQDS